MRGRWRRPLLGRRGQTVLFTLLSLVLLLPLWGQYRFPLPSLEMEVRRYERQRLLPESTHVALVGEESWGHPFAVAWGSGYVLTSTMPVRGRMADVTLVPEGAGTMVLPLPGTAQIYEDGAFTGRCALAALKVPAGTVSAALELTLEEEGWSRTFLCQGVAQEGVYTFLTRPAGVDPRAEEAFQHFAQGRGNARWRAVFYDGGGGPLETVDGAMGS